MKFVCVQKSEREFVREIRKNSRMFGDFMADLLENREPEIAKRVLLNRFGMRVVGDVEVGDDFSVLKNGEVIVRER